MIGKILSEMIGPIFSVIDKAVEDKDQAALLKREIQEKLIDQKDSELKAKMKVVLAEVAGESWLQRNWRPLLMIVIVAIVANNYLVSPYLGAMFNVGLMLELPDQLWNLMTLGVGGYIAGRSGEKIVDKWKGKPTNFMDEVR